MDEIETVGLGQYWQDMPVGRRFKTVGRTVTEPDLVSFITHSGMLEVLFTKVETAKGESVIKGRLVPAALIFGFSEGLLVQAVMQGTGFAFLHMEMDIKGPTFVGDTIHTEVEVIESRPSKGKPGLGLVRTRNTVIKQDGTPVMVYTPLRLVKGRDFKPE